MRVHSSTSNETATQNARPDDGELTVQMKQVESLHVSTFHSSWPIQGRLFVQNRTDVLCQAHKGFVEAKNAQEA